MGSDGSVTGLDYDTPPGACPPGLPLDEHELEASMPSAAALPVVAQPPASAPRILLDPYLNAAPGGLSQHQLLCAFEKPYVSSQSRH